MKLEWTVTHEANIDIEDTYQSYLEECDCAQPQNEEEVEDCISYAISRNLVMPSGDEDLPDEVYDNLVKILKQRIGGIQMSMFEEE